MSKTDYEKARRKLIPDNEWDSAYLGRTAKPLQENQKQFIYNLCDKLGVERTLGEVKTSQGGYFHIKSFIRRLETKERMGLKVD